MKRRTFAKAFAAALLLPSGGFAMGQMMGMRGGHGPMGMMGASVRRNSVRPLTGMPLLIPPLYEGKRAGGVQQYWLALKESDAEIVQNALTDTWAVHADGHALPMLGPTLRMSRGAQVALHWRNHLPETTTMHGHGLHVPGPADGGPHQLIAPRRVWTARFSVDQPAATCWYHPHRMGYTAEHVYRGLAGFILIDDDDPAHAALPRSYGVDDIPLVIQDRVFDAAGQFYYAPSMHETRRGYIGDIVLTNGRASPRLEAKAGVLRLRLLNGSNSEVWTFSLSDGTPLHVIAGDGGLIDRPYPVHQLRLSPGERTEVLVDLTHRGGDRLPLMATGLISGLTHPVLRLDVASRPGPVRRLPETLQALPATPPPSTARRRRFQLGNMMALTINGAFMDMDVINERIRLGEDELWHVRSGMGMMHHNFHVHGTSFRILKRSDRALQPHERGLKDTVYLPPNTEAWLYVRFDKPADANAPYMYHCHFLEHEDAGMMGQFTVT